MDKSLQFQEGFTYTILGVLHGSDFLVHSNEIWCSTPTLLPLSFLLIGTDKYYLRYLIRTVSVVFGAVQAQLQLHTYEQFDTT